MMGCLELFLAMVNAMLLSFSFSTLSMRGESFIFSIPSIFFSFSESHSSLIISISLLDRLSSMLPIRKQLFFSLVSYSVSNNWMVSLYNSFRGDSFAGLSAGCGMILPSRNSVCGLNSCMS